MQKTFLAATLMYNYLQGLQEAKRRPLISWKSGCTRCSVGFLATLYLQATLCYQLEEERVYFVLSQLGFFMMPQMNFTKISSRALRRYRRLDRKHTRRNTCPITFLNVGFPTENYLIYLFCIKLQIWKQT